MFLDLPTELQHETYDNLQAEDRLTYPGGLISTKTDSFLLSTSVLSSWPNVALPPFCVPIR
jgi:hypothetical protein